MAIYQRTDYQGLKNRNQGGYNRGNYQPRRPVKTFHDLEVYQRALAESVFVATVIAPKIKIDQTVKPKKKSKTQVKLEIPHNNPETLTTANPRQLVLRNMLPCALGIPHLIAEAHSLRFGAGEDCLVLLEKVMLNCNKMVVYLEQVRDICVTGLETEVFEGKIKDYFVLRRKVLNLQRSWQKFITLKKLENINPLDQNKAGNNN